MSEHSHGADAEKLKVMLPYMLKHNREHIADMTVWRDKAGHIGLADVAQELEGVIEYLKKTNERIEAAIAMLDAAQAEI